MADEIKRIQPLSTPVLIANFGIGFTPPKHVVKEKIIYSNRLHKPLYRIDAIIEAYKKMKQHPLLQDWKLVIAAVGEETDNLKKLFRPRKSMGLNLSDGLMRKRMHIGTQNLLFGYLFPHQMLHLLVCWKQWRAVVFPLYPICLPTVSGLRMQKTDRLLMM